MLLLPNESLGAAAFREIYANSSLGGRSEGAALSDLFWYWLAPGPQMHQEHLENGPRYQSIAQLSRRILAVPRRDIEALVDRCYESAESLHPTGMKFLRLRDVLMPFWANFWHEIVFREACPPVSASKGLHGHTLGAAGVLETIICDLAFREKIIFGTPRLETPAEGTPASLILTPRSAPNLRRILKLNTGFGGINGALILGEPAP